MSDPQQAPGERARLIADLEEELRDIERSRRLNHDPYREATEHSLYTRCLAALTPPPSHSEQLPAQSEANWAGHLATTPFTPSPSPDQEGIETLIATPKIICLCGSTRFIEAFATLTWLLERREKAIVLGCTLLPTWFCNTPSHFGEATGTKEDCDEHHRRKIDLADEVMVIDIDGYIGESTRGEIEYAAATGKPVRYLRDEPELLRAALLPPVRPEGK